jgi:hypothetical protein
VGPSLVGAHGRPIDRIDSCRRPYPNDPLAPNSHPNE